jgi:hypothetical protein
LWVPAFFPAGKVAVLNHSPPSSAGVKTGCSYTFTPPICLNGMERDKFRFSFLGTYRQVLTVTRFQISVTCFSLESRSGLLRSCLHFSTLSDPCHITAIAHLKKYYENIILIFQFNRSHPVVFINTVVYWSVFKHNKYHKMTTLNVNTATCFGYFHIDLKMARK